MVRLTHWVRDKIAAISQTILSLYWRHNGHDGVSNHQRLDCLFSRFFRRRSKKTSKLCVANLCVENSSVTGEFPAQRASNARNLFIWWRHHLSAFSWTKMCGFRLRFQWSFFLTGFSWVRKNRESAAISSSRMSGKSVLRFEFIKFQHWFI